ncbi:MAG: thiamine pyrophosphate-dependent dehydrogenase E1 component subunit alpha [bacterium]|jgi:pyruvate dehydrogenase E1 component alpha subunit|nr:thiamine pyrophosphate-dependent dehydrogenase E1 component subunit alpha [candidate division KSB1 bacterium]MDH7560524.1 thiamine pyrophosphate-dependent dehydrogenase E1 component subunit alpha [bacterium]
MMAADLWFLYRQMLRSRRFEEEVKRLWEQGRISGEMHLGIGEEGVAAGVVTHLREGDAMALDHRGTPPLVVRGVDLVDLLREMLGDCRGLCAGRGGHMHLFSPEHLAASTGIVGAGAPLAVGFALAAQLLRPERVAVAFFGDGAMNQGMLLESLNLAVVWQLPVLFVCKHNAWAITTKSDTVTGGDLVQRVQGFGMPVATVDGTEVEAVWEAAGQAIAQARRGDGPWFLLATCSRLEGHLLGAGLHDPARLLHMASPTLRAITGRKGTGAGERATALATLLGIVAKAAAPRAQHRRDPVAKTRAKLAGDPQRLRALEEEVQKEIKYAVALAVGDGGGSGQR